MIFNTITPTIVFQEVPNEVSLCFSITGCKVGCNGCHSTELWHRNNGTTLTNNDFKYWLQRYKGLITCVIFFGGEWQPQALIEKLVIAKQLQLKTCLYSGQNHIDISITQHLTFLKTGAWQEKLGGLNSESTNQIFRHVPSGEKQNYLFLPKKNHNSLSKKTHTVNKETHYVTA